MLILDADVIIHLHQLGLWSRFVAAYDVYVAETVKDESQYFEDPTALSGRSYINWDDYASSGCVTVVSLEASKLREIYQRLGKAPIDLDAGEAETLALVLSGEVFEGTVCIADHAAIRAAVFLDMEEQAISLEEALARSQLSCANVQHQFRKQHFEKCLKQARIDKLTYM